MRARRALPLLAALGVALSLCAGRARTDKSIWAPPDSVSPAPDPLHGKRLLAENYERHGRVEEAVAQYLEMLARTPGDEALNLRVEALVRARMPRWLPPEAETLAPFSRTILEYELQAAAPAPRARASSRPTRILGGPHEGEAPEAAEGDARGKGAAAATQGGAGKADGVRYRLLVTEEQFSARETERWDEVHEETFSRIDHGYVWDEVKKRWEMRARVHWNGQAGVQLAPPALRAALTFYCLARSHLGMDPTWPWAHPIDLWLLESGEPGARAMGRSVYLYAVATPRSDGEWLRQIAHEYGHVCLPGIGGFTETDDPWADGHLGELLLAKWLSENKPPEWLMWSPDEWTGREAAERERLIAQARSLGAEEEKLRGVGGEARDYLLGLALHVEEVAGPSFLSTVLRRCPAGTAAQFVAAAAKAGGQEGMDIWGTLTQTTPRGEPAREPR